MYEHALWLRCMLAEQIEALTFVTAAETLPLYCSITSGSAQSHAVVNIYVCDTCCHIQLL